MHGICPFLDLSTGEFMCAEGGDFLFWQKIIQSFAPSEIIYSKASKKVAGRFI